MSAEEDEFDRIQTAARIEQLRSRLAMYAANEQWHRDELEKAIYRMGQLDERLGGGDD